MPHIRIEHTDNIHTTNIMDLFNSVREILIELADIKGENCKSRAIQLKNFHTGSNDNNKGFVHMEINILEGRPQETKDKIGRDTLFVLQNYFNNNTDVGPLQISVEIREMKPRDYFTSNSI